MAYTPFAQKPPEKAGKSLPSNAEKTAYNNKIKEWNLANAAGSSVPSSITATTITVSDNDVDKQDELTDKLPDTDQRRTSPNKKTEIRNKIAKSGVDVDSGTGSALGGSIAGMTFKLPQQRLEALLKKVHILPEGAKVGAKQTYGEVDGTRVIVAASEGFMIPTNYRVRIFPPIGVNPESGKVNLNQTEYESLKRNRSFDKKTAATLSQKARESAAMAGYFGSITSNKGEDPIGTAIDSIYRLSVGNNGAGFSMATGQDLKKGSIATRLDMFCNAVQIPEKQIQFGLYRHYGSPTPHPTAIQYGTLTTQFYSDGIMSIKKFFDAWQKLIYNDMTGNMNYYNEYIGSMQIMTQKTVLKDKSSYGIKGHGVVEPKENWATKAQGAVREFTKGYNDFFKGNETGELEEESRFTGFQTEVRDTYGVKVFECWPSIVGAISFGHDQVDTIGKLDVTWAYKSWDAFGYGVNGRGNNVPLSIGELRNEKDGFPFIEDLPPELAGPLTEGLTGAINSVPIGKMTGGKMFF